MKHSEILQLQKSLKSIEPFDGFKLNYAIKKNLNLIKAEIGPLADQEKEVFEIKTEFEKERIILATKYATDKEGKVQIKKDNNFDIQPQHKETFKKEFEDLQEKYKESIDEFKIKHKEFTDFLDTENASFEAYKISFKDIPEDLSTHNTEAIFEIIEE